MSKIILNYVVVFSICVQFIQAEELNSINNKISEITISESAVANPEPVGTYSNPISVLNFDPRVDLQERNLAEGQADITIRGGTFEGTGLKVGSANLYDPQTGHYLAEIPLASEMLSKPDVLTGIQNTTESFNSTAGTVSYGFTEIKDNLKIRAGGGTHNLNLQQAYVAQQNILQSGTGTLNIDLDAARSEMDGTRSQGASDFQRFSGRLQWLDTRSQTDLAYGYQDKYFTWPYLYVLPELHNLVKSSGVESEDLNTSLVIFSHRQEYNNDDFFELTSYYREHKDNYEFDVSNPGLFNEFRHQTQVYGTGFSGKNNLDFFDLKYSGQYLFDDLESTALVFNDFSSRSYGKFAVTPEKTFALNETDNLIITAGSAYDYSDRDDAEFSPVAGITWDFENQLSSDQQIYLEYAKSTKLPGYTAIASNPTSGLFKGNQELGRENSYNLELGYDLKKGSYKTHLATFYRRDRNLVDWTYSSLAQPFATRTANNVDIDVFGVETFVSKSWDQLNLIFGYTFLQKNEQYIIENIDASFYALNYPKHRLTTALVYQLCDQLTFRIDNEFRDQEDNVLRNSEDQAVFTTLSSTWQFLDIPELSVYLAVDNLWKVSFEDVPGVPGRGRLFSAGLNYKLS